MFSFSFLFHQELLQKEVEKTAAAIDSISAFAQSKSQFLQPAPTDTSAVSFDVLTVIMPTRKVKVDISAVTHWSGLLDAISTSCDRYIDSDSVMLVDNDSDDGGDGDGTSLPPIQNWEAFVVAERSTVKLVQPRLTPERTCYLLSLTSSPDLVPLHHRQRSGVHFDKLVERMQRTLQNYDRYLNRRKLATKVMAKVSIPHKKLLNLTHDWLEIFLPHCMKKVNRVSFGLLNDVECRRALKADPMLPRSRLKLGVPFVGKDVPTHSSEFAHPDIILGLTVFAYRYQGLRRADFDDMMSNMVSKFNHEIGPANERPTSLLYRKWVEASGGAIRGDDVNEEEEEEEEDDDDEGNNSNKSNGKGKAKKNKKKKKEQQKAKKAGSHQAEDEEEEETKEVVALKHLQLGNKDQMNKLYDLWRYHAAVLYHYLQDTVFRNYMRSQTVKMSASGQAIGGDMLFGRRLGFSGTPSDLLPKVKAVSRV